MEITLPGLRMAQWKLYRFYKDEVVFDTFLRFHCVKLHQDWSNLQFQQRINSTFILLFIFRFYVTCQNMTGFWIFDKWGVSIIKSGFLEMKGKKMKLVSYSGQSTSWSQAPPRWLRPRARLWVRPRPRPRRWLRPRREVLFAIIKY